MAAIHHVDHRQAAGVSRYFATFVRASDKLSGGASKSGKPFQSATFHFLGCARAFADHRPYQIGKHIGHLRHCPAERVRPVEALGDADHIDAHAVEIDNRPEGVGDGAEQPVELGDNDRRRALASDGQQLDRACLAIASSE
jgi:hypothetical protein